MFGYERPDAPGQLADVKKVTSGRRLVRWGRKFMADTQRGHLPLGDRVTVASITTERLIMTVTDRA